MQAALGPEAGRLIRQQTLGSLPVAKRLWREYIGLAPVVAKSCESHPRSPREPKKTTGRSVFLAIAMELVEAPRVEQERAQRGASQETA